MPYSGSSDKNLPDAVKKLPAKKKKQWVAVFNSAYNKCKKDGGDHKKCETFAFKNAWGVVKKKSSLEFILDGIKELLNPYLSLLPEERAISIADVYDSVYKQGREKDGMAWLNSVYFDDDGSAFAVFSSDGKLFRANISISDGQVALGEWQQVKIDFPPVEQSRMTITRDADGKFRWIGISSSSVLNRVGQIDSKKLFDSFVEYAEETGDYPIRMFYHTGEALRTGQCDFLARDENLLITSGVYDDSELAKREIAARQNDPDYWGDSIGFIPTTEPEMWEVGDGITIPVYNQGIMREVSTLPETEAAAHYTVMPTLKEVNRTMEGKQLEAFYKLFGDDHEAADEWLEENAQELNRAIQESGQITRANEEDEEIESEELETEEPTEEPETEEPELIMDDETMGELARQIAGNIDFEPILEPINTQLTEMSETMTTLRERVDALEKTQDERLQALEEEEERRRQEWLTDLPPRTKVRITHRPRNRNKEEEEDKPEANSLEGDEVLEEALKGFKVRY